MARVAALWRFPVKSAGGEPVDRFLIARGGPVGDRLWGVIDSDGTVVSAKHPRRGGRLLRVRCAHDDASGATSVDVPGAGWLRAGSVEANTALSRWIDRPVRLAREVPAGLRLFRTWPAEPGLVPEWEPTARPGAEAVTEVAGAARRRSFVDYGAVHVVTAEALARLAAEAATAVDPIRFRPNLVIEEMADPPPGSRLQVGGAVVRVDIPTPRCVVPGLEQPGVPGDHGLLRTLARHDRRPVGQLGRAACFGFYAIVDHPGQVARGDDVRLL